MEQRDEAGRTEYPAIRELKVIAQPLILEFLDSQSVSHVITSYLNGALSYAWPKAAHLNQRLSFSRRAPASAVLVLPAVAITAANGASMVW